MARLKRIVVAGRAHHVTQRGNRREAIFFEDGDQAIEYVRFGGATTAENQPDGSWSEYIYAGGQRIAKASSTVGNVFHHSGICGNCSGGLSNFILSGLASSVVGYPIRSGDHLIFQQMQSNARAGLYLYAGDGTNSMWNLTDQNGDWINSSSIADGSWHMRTVDLSSWAGKIFAGSVGVSVEANTPTGVQWDSYIADVSLVSADGTVQPFFTGQAVGYTPWSSGAGSSFDQETLGEPPPVATRYYLADHLGSARMEFSGGGWPIWSEDFAPYGQEIAPQSTPNNYKFTGKERDQESGLDYFGARYYASSMGRWMSPDWADKPEAVPYSSLGDPQSLNLYGYVGNNPLSRADATGHFGDYYTTEGKKIGTDGINDGAVHIVTNPSSVTFSPDHSIINLAASPIISGGDFSRAEGVAMHDAVSRSNAPNATDSTGGQHEEGFSTTKGVITNAPAGPTFKPGDDHASIMVPTTADTTLKVHVHPEGNGNTQFNQQPSAVDKNNVDPLSRPNMTSVVVGAGSGKVQVYNGQGVTATIPLKDFPKQ
jgi:RHS repeat-associated protein